MNDICCKLDKWGCDVSNALNRVLNDEHFYLQCVRTFSQDEEFELLGLALKNKDVTKAFEHAHLLKGTSSNLGITPLTSILISLVEPLREGSITNLNKEYKKLLNKRQKLLGILKKF